MNITSVVVEDDHTKSVERGDKLYYKKIFPYKKNNETDGFGIMAYTSEPKVSQTGNKLTLQLPPPNISNRVLKGCHE